MTKRTLALAVIGLFVTLAGGVIALRTVAAVSQDDIEYNGVYECGTGRSKFKILSCDGPGKLDKCEVFYVNPLTPGGGFKNSMSRSQVEGMVGQGCKTNAGGNTGTVPKPTTNNQTPPKPKADGAVSCFASDSEADTKNTHEKNFRGVLRNFWEKKPEESGPTVTLTFQKMTIGAPRSWRPTFDDAYSQADPKKPIYPVRATFTTCSDYTDAITTRKMEHIYDCYTHKTGGFQCSQTGASGPLAMKDVKEYIPKKR